MKVDVKHNTSRESTYHFRNNQLTTRDIQIEAIDHTDIRTNRQEKCRKSPPDHGKTQDQHTIHHYTPRPQLHLNRHHNLNKMKNQRTPNTKKTHNTTQHNTTQPTPDPTCTHTPPPKYQLYSSNQGDTNNTYRTKYIYKSTTANTKETHNTTQHNTTQPTAVATCTNTPPKNQLYSSDQRDTNSTDHTETILQITNPPTNLTRS